MEEVIQSKSSNVSVLDQFKLVKVPICWKCWDLLSVWRNVTVLTGMVNLENNDIHKFLR